MTRSSLAQLEAFYWVVRLGGFRAAAEQLHRTQPTISLRIQELESTLGVALFDRSGSRIQLTGASREMMPYVEQILALSSEMEDRLRHADPLHGLLRLGVNDTFALTCLPQMLTALERLYPDLRIDLRVDFSTVLGGQLADRELDMAFLVDPQLDEDVVIQRLGFLDSAWVASPRLRLPTGTLAPHDLSTQRILINPRPSHMYAAATAWFGTAGLEARRISTCNSIPILAALTVAGCGVSMLPVAILQDEIAANQLRMLATEPVVPPMTMCAAYRDASPGITAVLGIAAEILRPMGLLRPIAGDQTHTAR